MDTSWYQIEHQNTKYKYKIDEWTENPMGKRFCRIEHEFMKFSVAGNGGPIALTSQKTLVLTLREGDPSHQNICIFNNQGQILQLVKLDNPYVNIVVHLQFILSQFLLVLFQLGQEWLIDPYNGKITKLHIIGLKQMQQIKQAKVFENGFAILTSKSRFLYTKNAQNPCMQQFYNCQNQLLKNPNVCWRVFLSPRLIVNERVQLHLNHHDSGVIQIIQAKQRKVYYRCSTKQSNKQSKYPGLKKITYISELSPNKKSIVYFIAEAVDRQNMKKRKEANKQKINQAISTSMNKDINKDNINFIYKIVFAPSFVSDTIGSDQFNLYQLNFVQKQTHLNDKYAPNNISWCGNKAIIIQFTNQDLYLYSLNGENKKLIRQKSDEHKWCYLKQQIDGVRIITKTQNKIFRQIPASFISVFDSQSTQPGASLYRSYVAFQQKQPLQEDKSRKEEKKLIVAVQQCVKASRFQVNFDNAVRLLKAASYGKAFIPANTFPQQKNNIISETGKILRILHCFQSKLRYLTFEQLQSLTNDTLLKILFRYREHYFAFQIYQYLSKDQLFKNKIFTDWAYCKVQNSNQLDGDTCEIIKQKIQHQKGVSFIDIAHRAQQLGKHNLAMNLLQYEPSPAKRVSLLLWIGGQQNIQNLCIRFYQRAIQQSLKSRDLNLVMLAISKAVSSQLMPKQRIYALCTSHRIGQPVLRNYYRLFDGNAYIQYIKFYIKDTQVLILEHLRRAFIQKQYQKYKIQFQKVMELIKEYQSSMKDDWRKQTIPKLYNNLCQFMKYNAKLSLRTQKPKPILPIKQLHASLVKKDGGLATELKTFYKVSDKRVMMQQIKIFILQNKWQDLQSFVDKFQKKYSLPVQLIADRIIAKNQDLSIKIICKMPSKYKDEKYLLLQRIGKIKQAIMEASNKKDLDALKDIRSSLIDINMLNLCNQKITQLNKR